MVEEEAGPRPRQGFVPARLDGWSVEDLRAHIAALREEIGRAEAEIAKREAQRLAADAFFRKPSPPA